MKVAFVGYGGLSRQIEQMLISDDLDLSHRAIFDDICLERGMAEVLPFDAHLDDRFADFTFVLGLGYRHPAVKWDILQNLVAAGRELLTYVHPTSHVAPSATLEPGVIIYPMANIDSGVEIREAAVLNNSVVVSHDTVVGGCCYLSPGVVLSGNVELGERCFLGSSAVVANGVSIGHDVVVGIGSVVTDDVAPATSVIGNPLLEITSGLRLS